MSVRFNIALLAPEIPQNTGGIGRLCVNTGSSLHLVKPLGFSLEDKYLKRAGMDYWSHLDWHLYDNLDEMVLRHGGARRFFFSTHATRSLWDCSFSDGDFLIFGRESGGFDPEVHERYQDEIYTIPMPGGFSRSLNLANSAAIVLYEALRQNRRFLE